MLRFATCTFFILSFFTTQLYSQQAYPVALKKYQANYVGLHEVVKGGDKKFFRFYKIDEAFNVKASFEKIIDTVGFIMKTSDKTSQEFFKYGKINFSIHDTMLHLFIYQSKALRYTSYKDYLFLPFTDITTGDQTYGSGRYIDLLTTDIENDHVVIDFNKAYNPYCAYSANYNCPMPPRENTLPIAITAGEKSFGKPIH